MSILAQDHSDPGTYLESVGERILGEVLNRHPEVGSRPYLDLLMRDYPERGGKRFRPALILLCCEMMGGDPEDAVVSATALELFHNFALIHDDIEDSSEMRRGVKRFIESMAFPSPSTQETHSMESSTRCFLKIMKNWGLKKPCKSINILTW